MPIGLLPERPALKVRHAAGAVTPARLEREDHLLLVLPEGLPRARWQDVPYGDILRPMLRHSRDRTAVPALRAQVGKAAKTSIALAFAKPQLGTFSRLTHARKLIADALRSNPARIGLLVHGFDADAARAIAEACVAAAMAAAFTMPTLKREPATAPRLRSLRLFGLQERLDLKRLQAEAEGTDLARWLGALPSNVLGVSAYRERIELLASTHGWGLEVLDCDELAQRGAGAFLAVAQGSARRDAFIAHLSRVPDGTAAQPALSLVGKGVCFDTGGVNLKPAQHMQRMNEDMGGSAVVLGTLLALERLEVPWPVHAWLAVTENSISATAYKPQDVVCASNGTTIEVIHTDAEGRMVLADTLVLASREQPAVIIDFATLTGACVNALTSSYSGVFTNRSELNEVLIAAGRSSGERVWPFPLDDDYDQPLESKLADVKQCTIDGRGDHILAARFLKRFLDGAPPWIHVDLSASLHKGGLAHIPSDVTGFGVRFATHLMLDHKLLDELAD